MSISIKRTNSGDTDFIHLVAMLDADLAQRNGEEQAFYVQFNKLDLIRNVVIAYAGNIPVGCGAIKEYAVGTMEVKRMFTRTDQCGKGIASQLLNELEKWALELGYSKCLLETGMKQPEAIALYQKCGYTGIPNYGQYAGVENSVCFEKILK
jgi:putative acetyltransferase